NISRTRTDVSSERFHIDGLRHILEPFADYQWVPTPNVRSNEVFQFDTIRSELLKNNDSLSVTRYSPLDFPANNSIDAIDGENVIRFGLRQKLQTQRDGHTWTLIDLVG